MNYQQALTQTLNIALGRGYDIRLNAHPYAGKSDYKLIPGLLSLTARPYAIDPDTITGELQLLIYGNANVESEVLKIAEDIQSLITQINGKMQSITVDSATYKYAIYLQSSMPERVAFDTGCLRQMHRLQGSFIISSSGCIFGSDVSIKIDDLSVKTIQGAVGFSVNSEATEKGTEAQINRSSIISAITLDMLADTSTINKTIRDEICGVSALATHTVSITFSGETAITKSNLSMSAGQINIPVGALATVNITMQR